MSQNDEQPTSRRAARMVERERAARESGPIAPLEAPVETTAERARAGEAPVVSNAIFANASWAKPEQITAWAPVEPRVEDAPAPAEPATDSPSAPVAAAPEPPSDTASIVRRRDLRSRPADAPPVGLTGEILLGHAPTAPEASVAPLPHPEAPVAPPAHESTLAPAPVPAAEIPTAVPSAFAAPLPGAAPSWAGAAAPVSQPIDAVEDAPGEQTISRRARRAMAAPDPVDSTSTESADDATPEAVDETATMPPPTVVGVATSTWSAPDGHWSRQLADTDLDEPFENTFSRQVGSTAPATNALVILTAQPLDLSGPLTATGEIMLTGSIKLPDAFARTGATDQVDLHDRDELDDLFDDSSPLDLPADSQPIRAAAAVSGEHVLGSPIVSTGKPGRGNSVLTGLLITASALAVAVTGLIIAAFAFGIV